MQQYSAFFKTLYDETSPTGYLGHGTHCSVLRAVVFHDQMRKPLPEGHFKDFAIIWDKDHDTRVIEPLELIYRRGHLTSFLAFGESKGIFTAILAHQVSSEGAPTPPAPPFNPLLVKKIDDLDLSVRAANCLKNDNIVYVKDLVQRGEAEMLRAPDLGRKSFNEITEWLANEGLHLGMEEPPGWAEYIVEYNKYLEASHKHRPRAEVLQMEVRAICQSLDDPWASRVVSLESEKNYIISDEEQKVNMYLNNLVMLWQLGEIEDNEEDKEELAKWRAEIEDKKAIKSARGASR